MSDGLLNLRAEFEAVSAALGGQARRVLSLCRSEDFSDETNSSAMWAIAQLLESDSEVTIAHIVDILRLNEKLGPDSLSFLEHCSALESTDGEAAARLVAELGARRRLSALYKEQAELLDAGETRSAESAAAVTGQIFGIAAPGSEPSLSFAEIADQHDAKMVELQAGRVVGYTTGLPTVDRMLMKMHRKEFVMVTGPPSCQPAGSKVLAIDGSWKNVEDVKMGDYVLSPQDDGSVIQARVLGTSKIVEQEVVEISGKHRPDLNYRCSMDHIIPLVALNRPRHKKEPRRRLSEIKNVKVSDFLKRGKTWRDKARIFTTPAFDLPTKTYEIAPYVMGAIIGDGSVTGSNLNGQFTSADSEILSSMVELGAEFGRASWRNGAWRVYTTGEFNQKLKKSKVWGCNGHSKFVPIEYKLGSLQQRLELLAGLIDTDGNKHSYCSVSKQLAEDFRDLVFSIGGYAKITPTITDYGTEKTFLAYYVYYSLGEYSIPVRLSYKKASFSRKKNIRNMAFNVTACGKETVFGFTLDSPSQWFITDNWLVTHNSLKSLFAEKMLLANAVETQTPSAAYVLEMDSAEWMERAIMQFTDRISNANKFRGSLEYGVPAFTEAEAQEVVRVKEYVRTLPIYVSDRKYTEYEIHEDVIRRIENDGVKIVLVDQAQLVKRGDGNNRVNELEAISRGFRLIALKYNVLVILLSKMSKAGMGAAFREEDLNGTEMAGSSAFESDGSIVLATRMRKAEFLCDCSDEEMTNFKRNNKGRPKHPTNEYLFCTDCRNGPNRGRIYKSPRRFGWVSILKARAGEIDDRIHTVFHGAKLRLDERTPEEPESEVRTTAAVAARG